MKESAINYQTSVVCCRLHSFKLLIFFLIIVNVSVVTAKGNNFNPQNKILLQTGIKNLYNLELDKADYYFNAVVKSTSNSPAGYIYLAITTIGRELLAGSSKKLKKETEFYIDAALKIALKSNLSDNNPWNLFFAGEAFILKSYLESKKNNYVSSLRWLKHGIKKINKAATFKASNADANMILGTYKYYVSYMPWYTRYFANLFIEPINQEAGMSKLEDAAANAIFVRPEARLLLSGAFFWEREPDIALNILMKLKKRFPDNYLIPILNQKILFNQKFYSEAFDSATNNFYKIENDNRSYVHELLIDQYYELGLINTANSNYYKALANFDSSYKLSKNKPHFKAWALLREGTVYDIINQRNMARKCYKEAKKINFDSELLKNYCKTFLKYPYKGEVLE